MGLPVGLHSQATRQAGEQAESTATLQVPLAHLAKCLPACSVLACLLAVVLALSVITQPVTCRTDCHGSPVG
jgi:hypothetical protein